MSAIHFSIPSSFLPRSEDRAGLGHRDSPGGELVSLQPSCFSAQGASHHHQKADLTELCIARGACCSPLGVLPSRPSRSRCHPWGSSECWLSQGCSPGLWGRADPMGTGETLLGLGSLSLLSAKQGELHLSPCRLVYPWGTTWTDGQGTKLSRERDMGRSDCGSFPYFRAMRWQKLQAHNTWAAKHLGKGCRDSPASVALPPRSALEHLLQKWGFCY